MAFLEQFKSLFGGLVAFTILLADTQQSHTGIVLSQNVFGIGVAHDSKLK